MAIKVRITPEGYERLKAELEQDYQRLAEATRILQELTGSSDDYDDSGLEDAKSEKSRIEQRIDKREVELSRAEIISSVDSSTVDIGSRVTLRDVAAKASFDVQVVSPVEAGVLDTDIPKVSDESPLGKAIMGRRPGDKFKVTINDRSVEYSIEAIA